MNSGFIVINSDVGGDWNMTFSFPYMTFSFPYIGNVIIPIDSYFSEGLKPPTSDSFVWESLERVTTCRPLHMTFKICP